MRFNLFRFSSKTKMDNVIQNYIELCEAEIKSQKGFDALIVDIEKKVSKIEEDIKLMEDGIDGVLDDYNNKDSEIIKGIKRYDNKYYKTKDNLTLLINYISLLTLPETFENKKLAMEKLIHKLSGKKQNVTSNTNFLSLHLNIPELRRLNSKVEKYALSTDVKIDPAKRIQKLFDKIHALTQFFNDRKQYLYNIKASIAIMRASPELKVHSLFRSSKVAPKDSVSIKLPSKKLK